MKSLAGAGFSGTRWKAVEEIAISLAEEVAKSDPDGIDLVLFQCGHLESFENQSDERAVREIFRKVSPFGGTPLHLAVRYMVDRFICQKADIEPSFGIVLTDGVPDDEMAVVREIKRAADFMKAKSLPDETFTIWFIQVGDDPDGTRYLKLLDDKIESAVGFDLVDTTPVTELNGDIESMILKAIKD